MVLTGPAATSEHGPTHVRAVSDTSAARPVDEPPDAAVWPPAPGEPGGPPWPWPVTASGAAPVASPAAGDQEPPTAADPSGAVGPTAAPPLTPAAATADLPTGKAEPARALIGEDVAALAPICDDQARGFAARFTADYLSWDEDVPQVRWQVLATYYADPAAAVLGWTGCGRQHVDLVIPGVVIRLSPQRLVVQTTARIVLHERIGPSSRAPRTGHRTSSRPRRPGCSGRPRRRPGPGPGGQPRRPGPSCTSRWDAAPTAGSRYSRAASRGMPDPERARHDPPVGRCVGAARHVDTFLR